jgi:hypothetical protein
LQLNSSKIWLNGKYRISGLQKLLREARDVCGEGVKKIISEPLRLLWIAVEELNDHKEVTAP